MKKVLPLLLLLFLVSCPSQSFSLQDLLKEEDKSLPHVLSWELEENVSFHIVFSETVELTEFLVQDILSRPSSLGKDFTITLPQELLPGEETPLSLTVKKGNGNTLRAVFRLSGRNYHLPSLLLNEISTKGTSSSPDRIELLCLEKGDTMGMVLTDEKTERSYILPSLLLEKDDLVVIYWNNRTSRKKEEHLEGYTTYFLNAEAGATLNSSSGVLSLRTALGGDVVDAFLYSDFAEENHGGFGTAKGEEAAEAMKEKEAWDGEAVDSSFVTSSRVFARLPGGVDSNASGDWFITASRRSTFGERNVYIPYEE